MKPHIYPLFSSPVYHIEDTGFRPSKELLETLESLPTKPLGHIGLTEDVYILNRSDMVEARDICQYHLDKYLKTICCYKENFSITNSWLSRNTKFQGHNFHSHANSMFSGCLYLRASLSNAPVGFHGRNQLSREFNFAYNYTEHNVYNSNDWYIPVQTGSLVIFPSYLDHGSLPNQEQEKRICLGFNSFINDKLGDLNYASDIDLRRNV